MTEKAGAHSPRKKAIRTLVQRAFPFLPKKPTLKGKGAYGAANLFHTTL